MAEIQFSSDVTNALEKVRGSDGRLNVSSRGDSRGYYNSRDESESYSLVFDDANATTGDYVLYVRNDKTDGDHLVIQSCIAGCEAASAIYKLVVVTGTASGGATATPANLNRGGLVKTAATTAITTTDSSVSPIAGLTGSAEMNIGGTGVAYQTVECDLQDQVRLGQGQAVAIELEYASAVDMRTFGTLKFYFEPSGT